MPDENENGAATVDNKVKRFRPSGETISIISSGAIPKPLESRHLGPRQVEAQHAALLAERRNRFIAEDPLVKIIDAGGDAFSVLREIKREIARESANLHFDRLEFDRRGRDPSTASARRIEALRRIADIELKIRELDQHALNLSSEKMQRIFALWVDTMREIAQEVLPPEVMDLFFNRFATAMDGWEERAQDSLR